jgi:hypothetical protein
MVDYFQKSQYIDDDYHPYLLIDSLTKPHQSLSGKLFDEGGQNKTIKSPLLVAIPCILIH